MSEGIDIDTSGRSLLNPVVTDRCSGVERVIEISPFQHLPLIGGVRPHAGVTIGLQLQSHREVIGITRMRLLQLAHARVRAEQMLHVVSELVGEHICLRQLT